MSELWYARSLTCPTYGPIPRYWIKSRGPTMASALKTKAGAAIRARARKTDVRACTSGWFWQSVPIRFQVKAMASSRSTSTPRLARNKMMSTYSPSTAGLDQLTSHCQELKVVQTQPWACSSQVKLPGAKSGKISGSERS